MSNSERGLLERVYNLCDKSDYDEAKAYYGNDLNSYADFINYYFYFYFVKGGRYGLLHNLNGPAIAYKNKTIVEYYIYGDLLSEAEFNEALYLLNHPELEAFT